MKGPIESAGTALGRYDLIMLFDVIEHFSDPLASMTAVLGHLKGDGLLVLQTPCLDDATGWLAQLSSRLNTPFSFRRRASADSWTHRAPRSQV